MYANTSISVGMKGASKAMAAMNKVCTADINVVIDHFISFFIAFHSS